MIEFGSHFAPVLCRRVILVLLFTLISTQLRAAMVDRVVAVVNDEVITLSEVEEEAADAYRTLAQSLSGESLVKALAEARESALDSIIDQRLIIQRAEKYNITVSDEEIESAFTRIRTGKYRSLDDEAFNEALKQSGMTVDRLKQRLKTQIMQSKLVAFDVRSKVVITDDMILDYYDENYTARVDKGRYYLLQIGISWDSAANDDEKKLRRKQAERIRRMAVEGEDFKELAKKYSDLPSAPDGGDIGIFTLDDMAASMREAIAPLNPGEISEIVETANGYQFFKLLSGEDNAIIVTASFESVKDEIREKLYEEKLKDEYSDWVKKIKDQAFIQKM